MLLCDWFNWAYAVPGATSVPFRTHEAHQTAGTCWAEEQAPQTAAHPQATSYAIARCDPRYRVAWPVGVGGVAVLCSRLPHV